MSASFNNMQPVKIKKAFSWSIAYLSLKMSDIQQELKLSAVFTYKKPANLSTQPVLNAHSVAFEENIESLWSILKAQ